MAAMANSSSETKQETMYYEELDALTVETTILSPMEHKQMSTKVKKKTHGKKKARRNRSIMKEQARKLQKDTMIPPGRGGATITYCRSTHKLYLLGGANRKGDSFDMKEVNVFDLQSAHSEGVFGCV